MADEAPTPSPSPAPDAKPNPTPVAATPGAPNPGAPKPGGKPIPEKWQRGGPARTDRPRRDDSAKTPAAAPRDFGVFKPNKRDLDQSIEEELNAAMLGMKDLPPLNAPEPKTTPENSATGGRKKGRVVSIRGRDVFIDVPGGRSQGLLSLDELDGKVPAIGEELEFSIEGYNSSDGLLILTREGAARVVTDWSVVSLGMIVEARLTEMNKNSTGFMVEVNGLRGFMPISQTDLYRVENPEQFVNQRMKVMVIEVEPQERNLIVSRRALLERERKLKEAEFWTALEEGQVREGVVKSIKPFGAFVDLGGADGLIPIGELSWSRVNTVEEVLKLGQKVEVKVSRLDREAKKISLSLRAMAGNPWDDFAANHRPGARIPGKVTRVAEFGAFVELAPGIEGLIHVSELSTGRVRRVRDAVSEGQEVLVQILAIDQETRRIGLSLKAISAEAEDAAADAESAEDDADKAAALTALENRKPNPTLRGGIGGNAVKFDME